MTAADYARTIAETITAEVEGSDDPVTAAADYAAEALDVQYLVDGRYRDGYPIREVRLIVTVGGPSAEVHYRGVDDLAVIAWWSGERAETMVHAPHLAAELEHYGDVHYVEVMR